MSRAPMLEAAVPLATWRTEVDYFTNGRPSGRMRIVGEWCGDKVELASIPAYGGDVTTEDIAGVIDDALDALRHARGIPVESTATSSQREHDASSTEKPGAAK